MKVDYNGLRKNILDDYRSLQSLFDGSIKSDGELLVNGYELEKIMGELRNGLVFLAGTYLPEAGIDNLIDDDFDLPTYFFEIECEECGWLITKEQYKKERLCKNCSEYQVAEDCEI